MQPNNSTRIRSRLPRQSIKSLLADDEGSAYSISVVLMIPILLAYVTLAIEVCLLFISQQSLNTSSQTAVHTFKAWYGHRDSLEAEGKSIEAVIHESVVRSMVPFSSAMANEVSGKEESMQQVMIELGLDDLACRRFLKKRQAIFDRTLVRIEPAELETKGCWIHVQYDAPLWIPFFSRLLQTKIASDGNPARTLDRTIWIPLSELDFERRSIGIPYSPHLAADWQL